MPAQVVLPIGIHLDEPPPTLEEGYEVHWRDDDDPSHYFFVAHVSALRLERILRDAFDRLPELCHAVLEVRRSDEEFDGDPQGPTHDRWVSDLIHRDELFGIVDRYGFQLVHDGMVGFGAYDPESPFEVFVDDHKLLNLFAPTLDAFEPLLNRYHIPHRKQIATVVELEHEHHTVTSVAQRCSTPRSAYLSRRRFDVRWFAGAIRKRLGMRPSQPASEG